jgi:hypothetical protein
MNCQVLQLEFMPENSQFCAWILAFLGNFAGVRLLTFNLLTFRAVA